MQDQILAALKKLGHPVSPGELADHLEIEHGKLGYHLKAALDAGTVIAHGKSRRAGASACRA
jgi:DNA-binding transcriptional ArsR family regulator